MIEALFCMIALLSVGFKQRRESALENLALRHYAEFRIMPSRCSTSA